MVYLYFLFLVVLYLLLYLYCCLFGYDLVCVYCAYLVTALLCSVFVVY